MTNWKYKLDLSFLEPLIRSKTPITNKEAIKVRKKVMEAIRDLPEGMSSTSQQYFIQQFEKVRSVKGFDTVLNELYDYCDQH